MNVVQVLENPAFFDVILCHRASRFDVFEESKHPIPLGPVQCSAGDTFLRVRAQIVYEFQRSSFTCPWEFEELNKVFGPYIKYVIIILLHIIITLYN